MFLHLKILDIRINAGLNYFLCFFSRLNLCYGCSFVMLKSFVNLKEMLDFVKSVARNLVNIFIAILVGVVNRNCDDFFILRAAVLHDEHADRCALNYCHRLYSFTAKHKNIKRVIVACICSRNKTVVSRVVG